MQLILELLVYRLLHLYKILVLHWEQLQVLINQQLRDIWNNPFDGNNNGDPDGYEDHDSISFYVNILGDYDRSSLVDFEDLVQFQQNWWSDSTILSHEVGPASGQPPYMQLQPDTLMNFEDLMVFVQMWNWSNGFENDDGRLSKSKIYLYTPHFPCLNCNVNKRYTLQH